MKLLQPGGVNIAGHHVSYGLLAVILAVPVAFLAIRQFGQGGGATVGADPNAMGTTAVYGGDQEAAISNLNQLINDLTGKVDALGTTPPPPAPMPDPFHRCDNCGKVPPALYEWRKRHHYGQAALNAPPTTRQLDISRIA